MLGLGNHVQECGGALENLLQVLGLGNQVQEYCGVLENLLQVPGVIWVDKLPGHSLVPHIAAQEECAVLGWAGQGGVGLV